MPRPSPLSLGLFSNNQLANEVNDDALLQQKTVCPPNPAHEFDHANIVEADDSQFNGLHVERHTFLTDPLDKGQRDAGFVATAPHLLPFPM